ncbi:hypothetical protein DUNSADRAFT_12979, partial [Dunaliella salina]
MFSELNLILVSCRCFWSYKHAGKLVLGIVLLMIFLRVPLSLSTHIERASSSAMQMSLERMPSTGCLRGCGDTYMYDDFASLCLECIHLSDRFMHQQFCIGMKKSVCVC